MGAPSPTIGQHEGEHSANQLPDRVLHQPKDERHEDEAAALEGDERRVSWRRSNARAQRRQNGRADGEQAGNAEGEKVQRISQKLHGRRRELLQLGGLQWWGFLTPLKRGDISE